MFRTKLRLVFGILACLFLSCGFAEQQHKIESRIVQGSDAVRGQFPFYVSIKIRFQRQISFCGGSLISNQWVVTAAHCLKRALALLVTLGSLRVYDKEVGRKIFNIEPLKSKSNQIFVHPDYSEAFKSNDIGLIKLDSPVEFSDVIQPIHFPCSTTSNGVDVIAIGNGLMHTKDVNIAQTLQYTELKTVSLLKCLPYHPFMAFRETIICSKGEEKKSTCAGDSGGPLIENQNLVGITSAGSALFGCERGVPQVFTRISEYRLWIAKITGVTCKRDKSDSGSINSSNGHVTDDAWYPDSVGPNYWTNFI